MPPVLPLILSSTPPPSGEPRKEQKEIRAREQHQSINHSSAFVHLTGLTEEPVTKFREKVISAFATRKEKNTSRGSQR